MVNFKDNLPKLYMMSITYYNNREKSLEGK